jgi:hypothetical protein
VTRGSRGVLLGVSALLVLGGAAGLIRLLTTAGSVSDYIRDEYRPVSRSADGRSEVYAAGTGPVQTADRIAGRWRPADRINDPGGVFLRYSALMVAVASDGARGSRIYVDPEREGYARWYPYVGGWWGTFSGTGEGFRGGGPGAGK